MRLASGGGSGGGGDGARAVGSMMLLVALRCTRSSLTSCFLVRPLVVLQSPPETTLVSPCAVPIEWQLQYQRTTLTTSAAWPF